MFLNLESYNYSLEKETEEKYQNGKTSTYIYTGWPFVT